MLLEEEGSDGERGGSIADLMLDLAPLPLLSSEKAVVVVTGRGEIASQWSDSSSSIEGLEEGRRAA